MKVIVLTPERWKIDGGVAFGVIPKTMWSKYYSADENNLIEMANHCLLIEDGKRLWLIDAGFGSKREDKYYRFKYIFERNSWDDLLQKHGYSRTDITDVVFTHLHDDHCGGAVYTDDKGELTLSFPNAQYHIGKKQFESACDPNPREAAAYFKDNLELILEKAKINWISDEKAIDDSPFEFKIMNGHTQGLLVPIISIKNKKIVFTNDFIPSAAHISPVWVASVDIEPILALKEKEVFLKEAVKNEWILFFEHAPLLNSAVKVSQDIKGYLAIPVSIESEEFC